MSAARFWDENRKVLTIVGIAVLAALAAQVLIVRHVSSAAASDLAKYVTVSERLERDRRGQFDLADATVALHESNVDLTKELSGLKKRVEIPFQDWTTIPDEYSGDPGAYFALKHAQVQQELMILCVKMRVLLTDKALGFGEILNIPLDHSNAQVNLNRLSIVKRLVHLLTSARVTEIVAITPAEPGHTGPEGHGTFIREYPVKILVRAQLDPVMRFLHAIRRPGEFFVVVRGLVIRGHDQFGREVVDKDKAVDERELSVTISAAGMRFLTEEERATAERPIPAVRTQPRERIPKGH